MAILLYICILLRLDLARIPPRALKVSHNLIFFSAVVQYSHFALVSQSRIIIPAQWESIFHSWLSESLAAQSHFLHHLPESIDFKEVRTIMQVTHSQDMPSKHAPGSHLLQINGQLLTCTSKEFLFLFTIFYMSVHCKEKSSSSENSPFCALFRRIITSLLSMEIIKKAS